MERVQRVIRDSSRTTRSSATPASASRCVARRRPHRVAVAVDGRGRRQQRADHAQHRHRRRRAALRAADPGLEEIGCLTSDTLWDLRSCRAGCWCSAAGRSAASWRRPSRGWLAGHAGRDGCRADGARGRRTCRELVARALPGRRHTTCCTGHKAARFAIEERRKAADLRAARAANCASLSTCCCARSAASPNTAGYGLEELGIPVTKARTVETNEYLQTLYPNIYACGDVAGPYQFTHAAAHQAWYAAVNAPVRPLPQFKADYSVIPWATFIEPEVARVGLNEQRGEGAGHCV